MRLRELISKAFKAGASRAINKRLAPYFWGCVGWLSIAKVFIPVLEYAEIAGSVAFFVIMTSLLTNNEETKWKVPSLGIVAKRSINIIISSLVAGAIIIAGLILFVIPGIIACKQLVYYPVVAASENASPIQVMKRSKELSRTNGYKLLYGTFIMIFPMLLLDPAIFIGPLLGSLQMDNLGINGISMICNLLICWLSYVVLNHMILIAYEEALFQEKQ